MKNFVVAFCILLSTQASAQTCLNFHKKNCIGSEEEGFEYNSQSKSGLFAPGQISTLKFVVYGGMDYRISICADPVFGIPLKFLIKDAKTGELIYDNATDEDANEVEFAIENTKTLKVEIIAPLSNAGGSGKEAKSNNQPVDGACIGLLILHKLSAKTGF